VSESLLPSYLDQSPAVRERFEDLKRRETVLDVKGLSKVFQSNGRTVTALKDVDFRVHRREFVTVIGPSGCGKSTLIRILAGLESASVGQVLLDGQPVHGPGPDRGMVFQSYTLFPWLTVKKNVMFGLLAQGRHTQVSAEREARQWIELVGLDKFIDAYPHQLSGGMKQRVAIARALANKPRILLMDEPFGALDAQTRCKMQSYLLEIWRNIDVTVLFITHDLDEAVLLADRILVLKAHPGEVQELIEVPVPRPRHANQLMTPEFLATRQRLDDLIHPPDTEDEEESGLKMVRLTRIGDDVEVQP
jgi:NitT/TauT family transport system ATP-binding protein